MKKKVLVKQREDFVSFLREYRIMSFAIAFIIGTAMNDLVLSFVNNLLMPLIDPLIPNATWRTAAWIFGPFQLQWGLFLGTLIRFIILALIIYVVVRKVLRYSPYPQETLVVKKHR